MTNYQQEQLSNFCENLSISVTNAHAAMYSDISTDVNQVARIIRRDVRIAQDMIGTSADIQTIIRDSERAARFGAEAI